MTSNSKFRRDANIRKTPEIIRVIPSLRTLSDACIETRSPWRSNLVPNAVWNVNGTPLERVRTAIFVRLFLSTTVIFLGLFWSQPQVVLFLPLRGRFVAVSTNLPCFVLLNTRVTFLVVDVVLTLSTFLNTSTHSGHCSDVSDSFLNTYFCRTGYCKLLSSLPIESPPANVSFTRAFAVFRHLSHRFQIVFCLAAFCTFV